MILNELSVITITFNAVKTIEETIKMTCPFPTSGHLEHLIIDGGSTDGTLEIIQSYASRYSHIRFISEPDKGQSHAMNKGIQLARG